MQLVRGLNVRAHLEDVDLALREVSPVAPLEVLLGESREIDPVKRFHVVAERFEDAADDAVLAGVNFNSYPSESVTPAIILS